MKTLILIVAALVIIGCLVLGANNTNNVSQATASNNVHSSEYANMDSVHCKLFGDVCQSYNNMLQAGEKASNTTKSVIDTTLDVGNSINGFIKFMVGAQ